MRVTVVLGAMRVAFWTDRVRNSFSLLYEFLSKHFTPPRRSSHLFPTCHWIPFRQNVVVLIFAEAVAADVEELVSQMTTV